MDADTLFDMKFIKNGGQRLKLKPYLCCFCDLVISDLCSILPKLEVTKDGSSIVYKKMTTRYLAAIRQGTEFEDEWPSQAIRKGTYKWTRNDIAYFRKEAIQKAKGFLRYALTKANEFEWQQKRDEQPEHCMTVIKHMKPTPPFMFHDFDSELLDNMDELFAVSSHTVSDKEAQGYPHEEEEIVPELHQNEDPVDQRSMMDMDADTSSPDPAIVEHISDGSKEDAPHEQEPYYEHEQQHGHWVPLVVELGLFATYPHCWNEVLEEHYFEPDSAHGFGANHFGDDAGTF